MNERIKRVMAQTFHVDGARIGDDVSPANLKEWDSLLHMNLIVALEEEFAVEFPERVLPDLTSVPAIRETLERLAAAA